MSPNPLHAPIDFRFVREARLLEFEPGEVVFAQGEKGYDCFIVDDGEAEILDQAEDGTLESIFRRTVRWRRRPGMHAVRLSLTVDWVGGLI